MAPTVSLAGFTLQTYPLVLLLAVGMGLWLSAREGQRLGVDGDRIYNLGFYALLATVLSARLAYVLSYWTAYRGALLSIFSPIPTALAWPEGTLIGGVVALVYWHNRRLPAGITLDAIVPGLALALALEKLGAFFGGHGFGEPTTLPWGIYWLGRIRHPVQIYEAAALLVILGVLCWPRVRRPPAGRSFAMFVALYSGSRLFLEAFSARTPLADNGVRVVQVVALGMMLGAVWFLYRRRFAVAGGTAGDGEEEGI